MKCWWTAPGAEINMQRVLLTLFSLMSVDVDVTLVHRRLFMCPLMFVCLSVRV